jgi:hypothetical protein
MMSSMEQGVTGAAEAQRKQRERGGAYQRRLGAYHRRLELAERPLVEEFGGAGILVDSAWDFVNGPTTDAAVPILLAHLYREYPYRVKEGTARSLTLKRLPPPVLERLIHEFKQIDLESRKSAPRMRISSINRWLL